MYEKNDWRILRKVFTQRLKIKYIKGGGIQMRVISTKEREYKELYS